MRQLPASVVFSALFLLTSALAAKAEDAGGWMKDDLTGCQVWSIDAPQPGEGISWSGTCMDDKASGWGVLVFWDAKGLVGRYVGEMAGGKLEGSGVLDMRDEDGDGFNEYVGNFSQSKPVGKGFLKLAGGARFYGELLDGLRHGKGTVVTPKGWQVNGEFVDGKPVGKFFINYTTDDGEHYIGEAENGERNGYGVLLSEGDFYAGHFANGVPSGLGVYIGKDGDRFTGEYKDGKPNGFGTSIDAEGNAVQGRFVDGDPDGTVLVTLTNGKQEATTVKAGGAQ